MRTPPESGDQDDEDQSFGRHDRTGDARRIRHHPDAMSTRGRGDPLGRGTARAHPGQPLARNPSCAPAPPVSLGGLSAGAQAPSLDALNTLATATSDASRSSAPSDPVVPPRPGKQHRRMPNPERAAAQSRARRPRACGIGAARPRNGLFARAGAQATFVAAQDGSAQSLLSFRDSAPNQMALGVLRAHQGATTPRLSNGNRKGSQIRPMALGAKLIAAAKQRR